MPDYDKPLPEPNQFTKSYWEAAKRHQLAIAKCSACGRLNHPPKPVCRFCQSDKLAPQVVSGKGTIYSYTVTHYPYHPGFVKNGPYPVVLVELEEDPRVRIVSNLVDYTPGQLKVGEPVEVVFDDVTAEVTLPKFRPRAAAAARGGR